MRNSNTTHDQFRWSRSSPSAAQQAADKGMIIMGNHRRKVSVPMIGLISQLEDLDVKDLRKEIRNVNRTIGKSTMVSVLKGILNHIYYDPVQEVRDDLLKQVCFPLS